MIRLTKDSVDLGIVTRDLAPMVAFYRDTLGFTDMGEAQSIVGTMHRLGCGTSHIKLVQPGTPLQIGLWQDEGSRADPAGRLAMGRGRALLEWSPQMVASRRPMHTSF